MPGKIVGRVAALWRYPIKSMLGENHSELVITTRGVEGDRAWALRDLASKRIASAKKFPRLLEFRARYEDGASDSSRVRITFPDGRAINVADPGASQAISEAAGNAFALEHLPQPKESAGINTATIFGDVPFDEVFPGLPADKAPDFFNLHAGSFFDSASIHLIATGTLGYMRAQSANASDYDPRRFRANILVDTADNDGGFVEDAWLSGMLAIGDVRITAMQPALRCVMTTMNQQNLPRDLNILRQTVKLHNAKLGVFAAVETGGTVRVGDPVILHT